MAQVQRGNEQAYRELLGDVYPLLLRYLGRRLGGPEAAEDVCQEILMTVHRVRHTFTPGRPFEPWLYSIARSRLIDHYRREGRRSIVVADTERVEVEQAEPPAEGMERLAAALATLPAIQQRAFSLLKIEGLDTVTAAEREGISVSALKVRAHRAYRALRVALGVEEGEL